MVKWPRNTVPFFKNNSYQKVAAKFSPANFISLYLLSFACARLQTAALRYAFPANDREQIFTCVRQNKTLHFTLKIKC